MNSQVTRLRDEISGKELALAKDEQEHKRLDKDNEALKVLSSALILFSFTLSSVFHVCWPVSCVSTGRAAADEAPA